jgi:hypothetical protein
MFNIPCNAVKPILYEYNYHGLQQSIKKANAIYDVTEPMRYHNYALQQSLSTYL